MTTGTEQEHTEYYIKRAPTPAAARQGPDSVCNRGVLFTGPRTAQCTCVKAVGRETCTFQFQQLSRGQSLSWQCGNVDSEKRALSSVHSPTCRTQQLLLAENDPSTKQVTSSKAFLFFNVVIKLAVATYQCMHKVI